MTVTDFTVAGADGTPIDLSTYAGQVLLVVNTASKCGFTPQYAGLEVLHRKWADRGFAVLAFPCNQFLGQEPGDPAEIASFCSLSYDVTFPIFAKIEVNGDGADPLFQHLKAEAPGLLGSRAIKWNFTKFLVNRAGKAIRRYASTTTPAEIDPDIERLL